MRSLNPRRGTALVEAAVALPALVAGLGVVAGTLQLGLWKMAADAGANAGAEILAEGGSLGLAEATALTALRAPPDTNPSANATETGSTGTVTVSLDLNTLLGPVEIGASRTVALPSEATGSSSTWPTPNPNPVPAPAPSPNPPRYWPPPSNNPGAGRGFIP
jgi:Flp pilus assembly protein TadG